MEDELPSKINDKAVVVKSKKSQFELPLQPCC